MNTAEAGKSLEAPPASRPAGRRAILLLLAILALAAALRFYRIGDKSLWLDEVMSVRLARSPSAVETVRDVAGYDVHPPLFPMVHFLWMRLGDSDGLARVPSAVFGVLAVAFVYLLTARLFGRAAGLMAALLLAVSTYDIYYSQEARNYSMIILLTLALSWLLLIIVPSGLPGEASAKSGERVPGWAWVAYAVVGAACLYTLVTSIFIIVAHWLIFLLQAKKTRRNIACGLCSQAAIGLAFLPWLPTLIHAQKTMAGIAAEQGGVPGPGPVQLLGAFGQWTVAPEFILGAKSAGITAPLGALVVVAIFLALARLWKNPKAAIALICLVFVPVALFLALPMKRVHVFDPKHLIFIQPLCMAAIAGFASATLMTPRPVRRIAPILPLLFVAANAALLPFYYDHDRQKERWPEVAQYISSVPDVKYIVVNPNRGVPYALARYYHGPAEITPPDFGLRISPDAEVTRVPDRVWLVLCWNEVLYPTQGLEGWFEKHMLLEKQAYFFGAPGRMIRCALYVKK